MNEFIQVAIEALTRSGFIVETAGGRYTVARGGDILLRQASTGEFYVFAVGFSAGFDAAIKMAERDASIERALEKSPAHQAAMEGRDQK